MPPQRIFFATHVFKISKFLGQHLSHLFPPLHRRTDKLTALVMAAVDLSDYDIDQLLSSAELSVASKQAQAVALNGNGNGNSSLTPATKPSPSTMVVGKAVKDVRDKPETLRVPRLKSDKKVRAHLHFPSASHMTKS